MRRSGTPLRKPSAALLGFGLVLTALLVLSAQDVEDAAPGPSFPRPSIADPAAARSFAEGIEQLEQKLYDEAKSTFSKLRRSLKGEARDAAERCYLEAVGGIETAKITNRFFKGQYRRSYDEAVKALRKYDGLVIAEELRAIVAECSELLFSVIETFEESQNRDPPPGRGGQGGATGFGPNTKIVEQDLPGASDKELRTAAVREGEKALQWRTGSEFSLVTFRDVEVDPRSHRYLNISVRCESAKAIPPLHILFDTEDGPISRGFGGPMRDPNALLRNRPGYSMAIKPKKTWQDLRLELKKFKGKGSDVEWSDVSCLRIVHVKGPEGRVYLDAIRLERSEEAAAAGVVPKEERRASHPMIAALDSGDMEVLSDHAPDEILETVTKLTPKARLKPGSQKEKITADDGRKTNLWLHVPSRRVKSYGLVIMLHDYSSNGRALLTSAYGDFAEKNGYVIAGPDAELPVAGKSNPDLPPQILGQPTQHWWTYRADGFVAAVLDQLAERLPIDRNRIILSGRGMGAWATWNLGMRFPDRFSAIVPFAGGLSLADYQSESLNSPYAPLIDNLKWLPSYNVHDAENRFVPVRFSRLLEAALLERKHDHTYEEIPEGGINLQGVAPYLERIARWLRPKRRVLHPKEVTHTIIDGGHPRQYWLRIDGRENENGPAKLTGRVVGKNRVELQSENVTAFTIFVDGELLETEGPIIVKLDGEVVHEAAVEESHEALVESWRGRRDPALLHSRMIRYSSEKKSP